MRYLADFFWRHSWDVGTLVQINYKFLIIFKYCIQIPEMSPKNVREISHPDQEIALYLSNFSKEVSQLTD